MPERLHALVWALVLALACGTAKPAPAAQSNEAPPAASASGARASDTEVQRVIDQLKAEEHFGRQRIERELRFKKTDTKPKPDRPGPPWLADFAGWLGRIGRAGVWALGALGVALLAVAVLRAQRRGSGDAALNVAAAAPRQVRQHDIRPESLPGNIGAAAWAQWQGGQARAALALLYRGALSRLVHRHALPIRASSTEIECMGLAERYLDAAQSDFFARLAQAMLQAAYAGRAPASDEVRALCDEFELRLAAGATKAPA